MWVGGAGEGGKGGAGEGREEGAGEGQTEGGRQGKGMREEGEEALGMGGVGGVIDRVFPAVLLAGAARSGARTVGQRRCGVCGSGNESFGHINLPK